MADQDAAVHIQPRLGGPEHRFSPREETGILRHAPSQRAVLGEAGAQPGAGNRETLLGQLFADVLDRELELLHLFAFASFDLLDAQEKIASSSPSQNDAPLIDESHELLHALGSDPLA